MKLLDKFLEEFDDIFEIHVVDQKPNFTVTINNISRMTSTVTEESLIDKDMISYETQNLIRNQLGQEIRKKILSEAFSVDIDGEYDIDVLIKVENRESRFSKLFGESKKYRNLRPDEIFKNIILENKTEHKSKYLICNTKIGAFIQDDYSAFSVNPNKPKYWSFANIGEYLTMDTYVDSFMRMEDNRVVIMDDKIKLFISEPKLEETFDGFEASIYRNYIIPNVRIMDFKGSFGFF